MLACTKIPFTNDRVSVPWLPKVWATGWSVGFDHLPVKHYRNNYWGLAGGYVREIDAKLAEATIRSAYPHFDFDGCTESEMFQFCDSVTRKRIQEIMTECLPW